MKKALIFIALNCFVVLTAAAQKITIQRVETKLITNEGIDFVGKVIEKSNDLFLFSTWNNDGILFLNGKEYSISNINFNISNNAVSSKLKDDKYFIFNSFDVAKFSINNQLFKKNGGSYFEVLFEDDNNYFYKRYNIRYQEGATNRIGGGTIGSTKMKASYSYLIKFGSATKTIELSKKSILSFFEDQEDELRKFVKEKELSYKKEKDLVEIIRYMLKKPSKLT